MWDFRPNIQEALRIVLVVACLTKNGSNDEKREI